MVFQQRPHCEFLLRNGIGKHVPGKNLFWSVNVYKSRGKRIFEIVHWPFELPPSQHWLTGPFGWHKWCSLARPSKGQCTISKILSFLIFSLFIEQNIFFSRDMFCLYHFKAKIHGVLCLYSIEVYDPLSNSITVYLDNCTNSFKKDYPIFV